MTIEQQVHNISKNIDYTIRMHEAKYILVASDCAGEGKSMFLSECSPVLAKIYNKKILIYDCQFERDDLLESSMVPPSNGSQFIKETHHSGLDYLHGDDLSFIKTFPENGKASSLMTHFTEVTRDYDLVFINMQTLKKAGKTTLPVLPIDGAILVRSAKSIGEKERSRTNDLLERDIPILGLVKNEGV